MAKLTCYLVLLTWTIAVVMGATLGSGGVSGRSSYPRTNRGFKNAQLSTARGFGKRDKDASSYLTHFQQQFPSSFNSAATLSSSSSPQTSAGVTLEGLYSSEGRLSIPRSWFTEEIQTNPDLAKFVVDRIVDENGDGELTPEEIFRRAYY